MIPKIEWPNSGFGLRSPFDRGKNERPIKLTFDSQSLKNINGVEADALTILYELSHLDLVSAFVFDGNDFPRITFTATSGKLDHSSIRIIEPNEDTLSWNAGINSSNADDDSVIRLMSAHSSSKHDELRKTRAAVIPANVHFALQRDVFVTNSQFLLNNRNNFKYENVRSPLDTLKIVGLYLRSRDEWIYRMTKNAQFQTPRELFYWTLARLKLSNISVLSLGETIKTRCARALQARDEIGKLFYSYSERDVNDRILYHFDYLNILLMGALDAAAVSINEKYKLVKRDSDCGFTRTNFVEKIKSVIPGFEEFLQDVNNNKLIEIVTSLRNTVHSERLQSNGRLVIELPETLRDELWDKTNDDSASDKWGLAYEKYNLLTNNETLVPKYRITLEPYTYAVYVVDQWMDLLDSVAKIVKDQQSDNLLDANSLSLSDADIDYSRRVSLLG